MTPGSLTFAVAIGLWSALSLGLLIGFLVGRRSGIEIGRRKERMSEIARSMARYPHAGKSTIDTGSWQ